MSKKIIQWQLSERTLTWVDSSTNNRLHRTPFFSTPIQTQYLFYTPVNGQLQLGIHVRRRVPNRFFRDLGLPLLEVRDTGFKTKIRDRKKYGRWDAKNNPRDYAIERNCGSGLRDWRTLLGTVFRGCALTTASTVFKIGKRCMIAERVRGFFAGTFLLGKYGVF